MRVSGKLKYLEFMFLGFLILQTTQSCGPKSFESKGAKNFSYERAVELQAALDEAFPKLDETTPGYFLLDKKEEANGEAEAFFLSKKNNEKALAAAGLTEVSLNKVVAVSLETASAKGFSKRSSVVNKMRFTLGVKDFKDPEEASKGNKTDFIADLKDFSRGAKHILIYSFVGSLLKKDLAALHLHKIFAKGMSEPKQEDIFNYTHMKDKDSVEDSTKEVYDKLHTSLLAFFKDLYKEIKKPITIKERTDPKVDSTWALVPAVVYPKAAWIIDLDGEDATRYKILRNENGDITGAHLASVQVSGEKKEDKFVNSANDLLGIKGNRAATGAIEKFVLDLKEFSKKDINGIEIPKNEHIIVIQTGLARDLIHAKKKQN